mmetsp:Transcript_27710/g.92076  ORF Transcript_27710/g.92076 Transcript_27710/m.92076 type:complete len:109 (-) Transcript_27710:1390-1716(-)
MGQQSTRCTYNKNTPHMRILHTGTLIQTDYKVSTKAVQLFRKAEACAASLPPLARGPPGIVCRRGREFDLGFGKLPAQPLPLLAPHAVLEGRRRWEDPIKWQDGPNTR